MLSNLKIERLKADQKTKRYADRDGLALEVRPSGKKKFIFRFQWNKKPQTITLGDYPNLSLADARNMASGYRGSINQGIDPRVSLKSEDKEPITLKVVAEQWYQKNCHRWREATQVLHRRSLTKNIVTIHHPQAFPDDVQVISI